MAGSIDGRQWLTEVLGDPFAPDYDVALQRRVFLLRLVVVVPLITIPIALMLWSRLELAYSPDAAYEGVLGWSTVAGAYVLAGALGLLVCTFGQLKSHTAFVLQLLCLILETVLTILVTYLTGAGVVAFCCFATLLVMSYRLYLGYSLGLAATILGTLSWLVLTFLGPGLPISPLQSVPATSMSLEWTESLWAMGYYLSGFIGSNAGANQIHKLRAELAKAQGRLLQEGRSAAVGHLVSGMAHEIRNPLNILQGGIDELQLLMQSGANHKEEGLSDDLRSDLEVCTRLIGRGGERIGEIVHNLNRLTASTRTDTAISNFEDVLCSTLDLLSPALRHPEIEIETTVGENIALPIPPSELSQVLLNLLTNACQAMPTGGTVQVVAKEESGQIMIDVIDNGIGIPMDIRPHIFDPFFTTREQGEGKGLGLSLSFQIVQDNEGDLYLVEESAETHFRVILPGLKHP